MFEKSIFCIVAILAPSILIGSSSFLEVTRLTITSGMSSNLSQIRPWTAELAALECLKKTIFSVVATQASSILIRSLKKKKKKKKKKSPVTVLVDSQVSDRCPWATFFFKSVSRPFQGYFSSYETGQSVSGEKMGEPREKPSGTPASRA